jgi:hypothetical protein
MGQKLSSPLLTLIRSTSHRPLPQHLLKRLLQTQKNLQHLEILPSGAVDAHHDPNTKDGCTAITDCLERAGLEQLQSVRVVPDIPQIAALCSIALQKSNSQTVISLEVDARHWVDAAHFAHAQNSMATKDQLVESLFAHLPRASPGHKGPFDNLTTLVLRDVKLNLSKYTWFTYLSLSKLQRLELHHCKAADIFLLQLTSGPEVPALKAFSMVHDLGENSHDRSILGIEQLLQDTGNGIVELELCLRNAPELPEVTSIARHGGSLRRLTLDIGSAKTCLRRGRAPRPLGGVCPTQTTNNRSARCQSRVQHTLCQIPRIRALHHKHRLEVLSLLSLPPTTRRFNQSASSPPKTMPSVVWSPRSSPSTAHARPHSRSLLSAPVSAPTATLGLVILCLTSTQSRTNSAPRLSRSLSRTFRRTLGQTVFSATRGGISTLHRADSSILSRKKGGTGRARKILGRQKVRGRPLLLAVDGCECEECILGVE